LGNITVLCATLGAAIIASTPLSKAHAAPVEAKAATAPKPPPDAPERVALARVQVLLDRAGFRPGKIDGLGGEFTQKAADRYCIANGLPPGTILDVSGIPTPFRLYTVSEADAAWVGPTSTNPAEQARFKALHYGSLWEAVSERFHCDLKYLQELNPGVEEITIGTVLRVPDVDEFSPRQVVDLKRLLASGAKPSPPTPSPTPNPAPEESGPLPFDLSQPIGTPKPTQQPTAIPDSTPEPTPEPVREPLRRLVLDRTERLVELYEDDRLAACFPCTPGSTKFPVPQGTWRITSNVLMPHFRWDKSVLETGVRSDNAHLLPPGPNSPVGIVWMGINRPSLGMHGTNSPDRIGRNQSSGCIRLANWDAFFLSQRLKPGTPLEVR
jgi:lipoprotein-anchoring transpeptidase ErfK/SrfK